MLWSELKKEYFVDYMKNQIGEYQYITYLLYARNFYDPKIQKKNN